MYTAILRIPDTTIAYYDIWSSPYTFSPRRVSRKKSKKPTVFLEDKRRSKLRINKVQYERLFRRNKKNRTIVVLFLTKYLAMVHYPCDSYFSLGVIARVKVGKNSL